MNVLLEIEHHNLYLTFFQVSVIVGIVESVQI